MEDIDEAGFTLCNPVESDCGRKLTCDRIHFRGDRTGLIVLDLSCNLLPSGDCPFYIPRQAIADERHIFRGKQRRHNKHVRGPDLMVSRHIRNGRDINNDRD